MARPSFVLLAGAFAAVVLAAVAPEAMAQGNATALSPAPAAPKTITAVLTKAGQFTKFLQLLQTTQEAEQINNQMKSKTSTGGLTVFAPTDAAFASLHSGSLNALSDQQKTSLVQFHVLSMLLPMAQFDTVSNPLRTQAGDTGRGKYPLNVTADGEGHANVSTGVVNATVDSTLYSGDRLVVYQVNKVLLPWALYGPPVPPAPAPGPAKKKAGPGVLADAPVADTAAAGTTTATASPSEAAPRGLARGGFFGLAVAVTVAWGAM